MKPNEATHSASMFNDIGPACSPHPVAIIAREDVKSHPKPLVEAYPLTARYEITKPMTTPVTYM